MKKCKKCEQVVYGKNETCNKCKNEYKKLWQRNKKNRLCEWCKKPFIPNGLSKECSLMCKLYNKKIEVNGCWNWTGKTNRFGYGELQHANRNLRANRASYETFIGEIPKGLFVCHTCDNRKCINPAHLWLGTPTENMQDASRKGRMKIASSKLSNHQARQIRRLLKKGQTQRRLSKKYKVSQSTISNIKLNLFYKEAGT